MRKIIYLIPFLLMGNIWSQSYPGCTDLSAGDFATSTFNVGNRPISVDFLENSNGTYDMYFARLGGQIVRRTAGGQQSTVASLGVAAFAYGGLTSFLLHPDFETNGWVFTSRMIQTPNWSGQNTKGAYTARIARHDFNATTGTLSNEKVLIDVPQIAVKNMAGSGSLNRAPDNNGTYAYFQNAQMRFDSKGNLYANLGADHRSHESYVFTHDAQYETSSGEARAANTKWPNGILRIHPDNSAKGYSIPAGNFREYYEKFFQDQGKTAIAQEYSVAADKVAPEVYTKGHRTNWTLKTHPTKDWLIWGEVGVTGAYDEIGIVKNPVFAGYPYYYGNNDLTFRYYIGHYGDRVVEDGPGYDQTQNANLNAANRLDTNAPKNMSPLNTGVQNLPPAFNPQISSQRYQSRSGGVRLSDVGLPYIINGAAGGNQATADSWYETGDGEVASWAQPPVATNMTRYTSITAGGIYAFDLRLDERNKFPPHLDEYLFIFDWEQNRADVAKVSEVGDKIVVDTVINLKTILGLAGIAQIIDGSFAPDGSLLLSSENGTITHVTYTGDCVRIDTSTSVRPNLISKSFLQLNNNGFQVMQDGNYEIELYNNLGQRLQSLNINQSGNYSFSEIFSKGSHSNVYLIKIRQDQNVNVRRILL